VLLRMYATACVLATSTSTSMYLQQDKTQAQQSARV
jgi:hypothetical protein